MVDPQPAQRGLDRTAYVGARATGTAVGAVRALHVHPELGGDHEVVAAPLERLAEQLLAGALAAVDVGGVEQRDADVLGGVEDVADAVEVDPAAERVAADADGADHQARVAQRAVGHLAHAVDPSQRASWSSAVACRSRSRTQKPWCSNSSLSTVREALGDAPAACVRRPAGAVGHRCGLLQLVGGDGREPGLELGGLLGAHGPDLGERRVGGAVEPLLLLVGHELDAQPHRREQVGASRGSSGGTTSRGRRPGGAASRRPTTRRSTRACSLPAGIASSRAYVASQSARSCRQRLAQVGRVVGADQQRAPDGVGRARPRRSRSPRRR